MKNKMKLIGIMTIIGVVSFASCKKDSANSMDSMGIEIATEESNVHLTTSNYQTVITNELISSSGEDYYTEGTIEYKINNQIVSVVDFGNSNDETAQLTVGGSNSEFKLKKNKEGSKYKKVIVKPLVKTDDCNYIVEGIIKYYEISTGEWAATIDYGDGTCDEWATKTWPAGSYGDKNWPAGSKTFSLNDWKKGSKK
jgi:hypothetical protein